MENNLYIIDSFSNDFFFLSNFYKILILWKNKLFPSTEHVYHSEKQLDLQYQTQFMVQNEINIWNQSHEQKLMDEISCFKAKKLGNIKNLENLRENWFKINIQLMEEICWLKFQIPHLTKLLLKTGDALIIEGNDWGDDFWGMIKDEDGIWHGRNELGKIHMKNRNKLR